MHCLKPAESCLRPTLLQLINSGWVYEHNRDTWAADGLIWVFCFNDVLNLKLISNFYSRLKLENKSDQFFVVNELLFSSFFLQKH